MPIGLRSAFALIFILVNSNALAVGLGKIELESSLNQQLEAKIALINADALDESEIIVVLASRADFERLRIDYYYQLTDLSFSVLRQSNGDHYIEVTSSKPIIEPFLNFLVQLNWPEGQIQREYTVLLDPPVFAVNKPILSEAASLQDIKKNTEQSFYNAPVKPDPIAQQLLSQSIIDTPRATLQEHLVQPGDTLSEIALAAYKETSIPLPSAMLIIQRENPRAFMRNNINLLKVGSLLRIPDQPIIEERIGDAIAEVNSQNQEYASFKSRELTELEIGHNNQIDDVTQVSDAGELRVLAVVDTPGQADKKSSDEENQALSLESSLLAAREDLDTVRRNNEEMNVRFDKLSEQVDNLVDLVELKDNQLAALRAELQRLQALEVERSLSSVTSKVLEEDRNDDSLLNNPFVLTALALLIVGWLVLVMILVRRRKAGALQKDSLYKAVSLNEIVLKDDDAKSLAHQNEIEEGFLQDRNDQRGRLDSVEEKGRGVGESEAEPSKTPDDAVSSQSNSDLGDNEIDRYSIKTGDVAETKPLARPDVDLDFDDQLSELGENELGLSDDSAATLDLDEDFEDFTFDVVEDSDDLHLEELTENENAEFLDFDEDPASKLDLARAYIEMGEAAGAREVLKEVLEEGTEQQVAEANELLDKLD